MLLRPGNAGSNTATDHILVLKQALAQLPGHVSGRRPGRSVLVRIDGAGSTHALLDWLTGQRLSYSVGFGLPARTGDLVAKIHDHVWQSAYDSDGQVRDGAWVAELTDLLNLSGWPTGMRVIVPKRCAKDTGLANLPLHDLDQNRIWCAIVSLACELTAWMQMLGLADHNARRWGPKRLRLRLLSAAGKLTGTGRRTRLHLNSRGTWTQLLLSAIQSLQALSAPAD